MKVNDILNEGPISQGIKAVGRGLGSAATGVIRGLDRMAGGTGDVGTAAQRAARASANERKKREIMMRELPRRALADFKEDLKQFGIKLDDPRTFNIRDVQQRMQVFAAKFFAGDESPEVREYILKTLPYEIVPSQINSTSVERYFEEIAKIRDNAEQWLAQNREEDQKLAAKQQAAEIQAAQQAQQAQQQSQTIPTFNTGVQIISPSSPIVFRYRNRDYVLNNNDRWVYLGSDKEVSPELGDFLKKHYHKL